MLPLKTSGLKLPITSRTRSPVQCSSVPGLWSVCTRGEDIVNHFSRATSALHNLQKSLAHWVVWQVIKPSEPRDEESMFLTWLMWNLLRTYLRNYIHREKDDHLEAYCRKKPAHIRISHNTRCFGKAPQIKDFANKRIKHDKYIYLRDLSNFALFTLGRDPIATVIQGPGVTIWIWSASACDRPPEPAVFTMSSLILTWSSLMRWRKLSEITEASRAGRWEPRRSIQSQSALYNLAFRGQNYNWLPVETVIPICCSV